ncbi:tyrosine-type recombinase/integrase [Corynebacterium meridianum]|uniref:Site-specific integrase n=1 Tax=Corynebacterium meridianum TaxID=2765363 RepID=A0A934I2B5_9CORY|nr:tyrosine-type recombinase/integrase [Corynebacterium meridianum]MBI8988811.1 site-specific integrase [Corynebacterium meridianum]
MRVDEFIEHMDTRVENSPTAPVMATKRGLTMFDTSFRSTFDTARKKAGVTREFTPHSGRSWSTMKLAEAGATPAEIGRLLGQSDVKTIPDVYLKVNADRPN